MHTRLKSNNINRERVGIATVFDDTLKQLSPGEKACRPNALPSWPDTVELLDDLHTLQLTSPGSDEARETLTRVVSVLQSQLEICTGANDVSALVNRFLAELPERRQALREDVETALRCDPAAASTDEVVLCYPGMRALAIYRSAHALFRLDVPLLPRLMTEIAHSITGIDIHPAAEIGKRFFIDHGTGIVIGATCIIGNDVKIYQGVTLGARSFPRTASGHIIKGRQRHPVIGDNVTIFAGATILGHVHIGPHSVIGGNVWITRDVPAGSKVTQRRPRQDSDQE